MENFNLVNTNNTTDSTSSQPVQPTSKSAATAEASATANMKKSDYDTETKVKDMADLKEKAPELYQKMMEGIATKIIGQNRRHQERIEKMWDESRRR